MFEKAARLKLRFDTPKGMLSVEDLWDLPLRSSTGRMVNLDAIAIELNRQLKDEGVSFVETAHGPDPIVQLKFDIVKRIITVKLDEARDLAAARNRAEKKQKLLEVLARKEDAALESASEADIRAMIDAL